MRNVAFGYREGVGPHEKTERWRYAVPRGWVGVLDYVMLRVNSTTVAGQGIVGIDFWSRGVVAWGVVLLDSAERFRRTRELRAGVTAVAGDVFTGWTINRDSVGVWVEVNAWIKEFEV